MADSSNSLSMPFILPNQAQKHVTHNEALRILDVLVQLGVEADDLQFPPPAPTDGDRFIVGDGATDQWAGHDRDVAVYETATWGFLTPKAGWRAWVTGREVFVVFDGSDWIELDSAEIQDIEALGLGMTAATDTPFSAKLNAALWTAVYSGDGGTGHMVQTVNKQNTPDDAGFVFQRNFQTRGLFGMFGSNDLRLTTTMDGSNFRDGLVIDSATGVASLPQLPRFKARTNYDNFAPANVWTRIGINVSEYNDQLAFDTTTNLFTAPADGSYMFGASLIFKKDAANGSKMGARFVLNEATVINGSTGETSGTHVDLLTSLSVQTMVVLSAGDTVALEGRMRADDAYFLADETCFWGYKVG